MHTLYISKPARNEGLIAVLSVRPSSCRSSGEYSRELPAVFLHFPLEEKGCWGPFYQLRQVLAKGRHLLQILLKALITERQFFFFITLTSVYYLKLIRTFKTYYTLQISALKVRMGIKFKNSQKRRARKSLKEGKVLPSKLPLLLSQGPRKRTKLQVNFTTDSTVKFFFQ